MVMMIMIMVSICAEENRDKFWWFGHTYSHTKAHRFSSLSAIISDMQLNQAFAQVPFYSVCLILSLLK